jgi:hypothetical protein
MSWYSIFYWITVADGVKSFFDVASNIFSWAAVVTLIIFILLTVAYGDERSNRIVREGDDEDNSWKYWIDAVRKIMIWTAVLSTITWMGYIFCPSKKDALIIVAGGAVGEFIVSDSSARQIPSEVMTLLRDKIRSEIKEVKLTDQIRDTLQDKTKEELIELLKNK